MKDNGTHIAYLSYDGLTDPLGQSQILPYLTNLAKIGFRFTIISFEKPALFKSGANEVHEICRTAGLTWVPLSYHKNPPVISTLYDLRKLDKALETLYQKDPFQIIHCRSYITSLTGQKFKRKYHVKFIFDMRGFWADERVEGGLWNLSNPLFRLTYKYFKRKEKEFFREADAVVSLTENARAEIKKIAPGSKHVSVIPTCTDLNLFDPSRISDREKEEFRKFLGIPSSSFVLLYLGSWGTWYMTKEMLEFYSLVKQGRPDAKFLIVTPDQVDIGDYGFREDVIIRRAKRRDVPLFISVSNASLFFIKPSYSKKASAATKMGELMAMNVPVISNTRWGDVEEYLPASVLVRSFTPEEYRRVIEQMKPTVNLRESAASHFSLESGVNKYAAVYRSLL